MAINKLQKKKQEEYDEEEDFVLNEKLNLNNKRGLNLTDRQETKTFYVRVPRNVILYSCSTEDKLTLPIYLYSGIKADKNNNYTVDTTVTLIAETFKPNEDIRKGTYAKVEERLIELGSDIPEFKIGNATVNGVGKCLFGNIENYINPENQIKEGNGGRRFSKEKRYGKRIKYNFVDRNICDMEGWIPITYEEYTYLENTVNKIKYEKLINGEKDKWNLVLLINLYVYLKYYILLYENISRATDKNITMHEGVLTMAKKFKAGPQTIIMALKQLENLGLIDIEQGFFNQKKSNRYLISKRWKKFCSE